MNRISIEPSFAAWRRAARVMLRQGVEPAQIEWIEVEAEVDGAGALVGGVGGDAAGAGSSNGNVSGSNTGLGNANANVSNLPLAIPRELLVRLKAAACFRSPDRWALLYRILWRWTHGERHVVGLNDRDGMLLNQRLQAVQHETDDLQTLTLFRRRDPSMGWPEFVGWYEPRHDILERAAARFVERMGDSTWMLATPHGAAFWNGMLLRIGRPAERMEAGLATSSSTDAEKAPQTANAVAPDADAIEQRVPKSPKDAMAGEAVTSEPTEALWLAYYARAFNAEPSSIPLRYWRTPPEGPPLPAHLARERSRHGAQSPAVAIPPAPPPEYSAMTPPLRDPTGPLATCRRCALWRNAKQAVPGVGPKLQASPEQTPLRRTAPDHAVIHEVIHEAIHEAIHEVIHAPLHAPIMLVGEQPGGHENQHGEPFTGPAAQLLDDALTRAGLDRAALHVTYAVKHYKWERLDGQRAHRTPARREIEACQYWLEKELMQIAPRVVVTLGATALKALTGPHINLSEYLGQTIDHGGRLIVPTWHPAFALRTADTRLRDDIMATIVAAFRHAAALAANGAAQPARLKGEQVQETPDAQR